MKTEITKGDNEITIKISGRLDTVTAAEFDKERAALGQIDKDLLVDCTDMEYISSAGLRSLIILLKETKGAGHTLRMCSLKPSVRQVFDMTGFSTLFNID